MRRAVARATAAACAAAARSTARMRTACLARLSCGARWAIPAGQVRVTEWGESMSAAWAGDADGAAHVTATVPDAARQSTPAAVSTVTL